MEMLETHLPSINVQVRNVHFREGILTGIFVVFILYKLMN